MKIPDAYFSGGLGQRVAPAAQAARPDPSGAVAVGQAAERMGATLLQGATQANEFQGQLDMQQAHFDRQETEKVLAEQNRIQREQEHELKQKTLERESATAKREYLNFTPALTDLQNQIINDPETSPEDYPKLFKEGAQKLANEKLFPAFNEHQKNQIESLVMGHINEASHQMFKAGQQEIDDQAWSESLSALDGLKNDPTRDARTKIAIIKDENFFGDTGRPAHEVEATRLKAVQEVIKEDVNAKFNSTKQDLASLRNLKKEIKSQNNGQYTYMPEMDLAERNSAVSMIMQKEERLLSEMEARRREAAAAAKQEATNLMMEYKDRVKTGWVPVTAADYRYQDQVRGAAATSPSLARQYEESTSYTTDMSKRLVMMKADPLGVAAAERGIIVPPLNIMDQANLPKQISDRLIIARQLGIKAVFKGEENKALSELMQTLPPRDQIKLLATITKPLGAAVTAATFNSAAEQVRQDRPDQAIMFKLYGMGKPAEAQLYSEGRAYLNGEKKDILKDKFTIIQQQAGERIDKQLETALAGLPTTRNTIKEAIITTYLGEAHRRNTPLDSLDKDLLADVTRRIAGETTRTGSYFGSNKITLVPDGMKPDQFLNSIKAITPADIARRGGVEGLDDAAAAKLLKSQAWHENDGGYTFVKDGKTLYGKDGKPFVFRIDDGVGAK